ncbi:MAG: hypothetical protein O2887_13950 [Bacteroidetes bacterium]|nr:hypothetical protein [Bacteroidota bacterium]MDA1121572.1 hypothetical protein [Bacteroidota bacterium]
MRKAVYIFSISILGPVIGLTSCDDNSHTLSCLDCAVVGFPICEGDPDPNTGIRLSKRDLQVSKDFFEKDFGLDCTLYDQQ